MLKQSQDDNVLVRRLPSEGGRPRLPCATKLNIFIDDPSPVLPILDNLKDDPERFIQKSIANCMRDILKDNPKIATSVLDDWSKLPSKNTQWVVKQARR